MTDETIKLIKEAGFDESGKIWFFHFSDGVIRISTNGKHIVESNEARTTTTWTATMEDLERNGYIEAFGHGRKCFKVTMKGYELIHSLPACSGCANHHLPRHSGSCKCRKVPATDEAPLPPPAPVMEPSFQEQI
jgi:hypothetical protein